MFDLETTGIDVETARIVTAHVGLIDMTGRSIVEGSWLADPGVADPRAGRGGARHHARSAPRPRGDPPAEVVAEIVAAVEAVFARGIPLVIYNAPYDLTLLDREAKRHGIASPVIGNVVDPLVMDKALDTYRKGKRTLEAASELYGVTLDDAHDAGADAIAAGRVAQAIAGKYPDELAVSAEELPPQAGGWCAEQAGLVPGVHAQEARSVLHRRRPVAAPQRLTQRGTGGPPEEDRPFQRLWGCLLGEALEALVELLDATGRVEDALLARVERVRSGRDLDVDTG